MTRCLISPFHLSKDVVYCRSVYHILFAEGAAAVDRVILHCDLNSFYASVELLSRPELRELPVAVCGDPASRKGIILAKNEPAKACGVKTAETIW